MWGLEQRPLGCFSTLVCVPLRHPVPLLPTSDSSSQLLPPAEMGSSPQPFPFGAVWVTCLSCASPSARGTKLCFGRPELSAVPTARTWVQRGSSRAQGACPSVSPWRRARSRPTRSKSGNGYPPLSHRPLPHAVGVPDRPPDAEHLPPALEGASGCHRGHGHRDPVRQRQVSRRCASSLRSEAL